MTLLARLVSHTCMRSLFAPRTSNSQISGLPCRPDSGETRGLRSDTTAGAMSCCLRYRGFGGGGCGLGTPVVSYAPRPMLSEVRCADIMGGEANCLSGRKSDFNVRSEWARSDGTRRPFYTSGRHNMGVDSQDDRAMRSLIKVAR